MNNRICILLLILMISSVQALKAQASKADTLYYMLDTLRVPLNDRMITSDMGAPHRFYTIHCPCLDAGIKPILRCNTTKEISIGEDEFNKLKLLSLANLIQLIKNEKEQFEQLHVLYFIEPKANGYSKNRTFFLGSAKKETQ